jgi:glutathione S-transferase
MYRLISATPSPYARKVRIALIEKAIPFQLETEVPWHSDTRTKLHNPLEKLPVLIAEDGTSVFESRYVLEWIETKHPMPPLAPRDPNELLTMKRYEIIADAVCDAFVLIFFENTREHPSPEWGARQQRKVDGGLSELARSIGDRSYCVGNELTYADIAVGSLLGWLKVRWAEGTWERDFPNLARYAQHLEQRPSFKSTVPYAQVIRERVA